jgi:hypothetical protein
MSSCVNFVVTTEPAETMERAGTRVPASSVQPDITPAYGPSMTGPVT